MNTKNICMIVAEKDFRDEELFETKEVLEKNGFNITVASTTTDTAKGMLGGTVTPDMLLNDVNPDNFDSIIFVGGNGSEQFFNDETAINLAKTAAEKNKTLGAICIAPSILAMSGVMDGKRGTVWSGADKYLNILKENNVTFTDEDVTVDGKLITANGPTSAKKFGEAISRLL